MFWSNSPGSTLPPSTPTDIPPRASLECLLFRNVSWSLADGIDHAWPGKRGRLRRGGWESRKAAGALWAGKSVLPDLLIFPAKLKYKTGFLCEIACILYGRGFKKLYVWNKILKEPWGSLSQTQVDQTEKLQLVTSGLYKPLFLPKSSWAQAEMTMFESKRLLTLVNRSEHWFPTKWSSKLQQKGPDRASSPMAPTPPRKRLPVQPPSRRSLGHCRWFTFSCWYISSLSTDQLSHFVKTLLHPCPGAWHHPRLTVANKLLLLKVIKVIKHIGLLHESNNLLNGPLKHFLMSVCGLL